MKTETTTSKPTIIALSGWKRSGKDTVAEYLVDNFGAKRLAFADQLKYMVTQLFGVSRETINNPETKEAPLAHYPVDPKDSFSKHVTFFMHGELKQPEGDSKRYWTPRALCILTGSIMRTVDSDYWVKQVVSQAEPGGLYVISDVRYKSEIQSLINSGSRVVSVRINRFDSSSSADPSERDLDDYSFDLIIENRQTLEDLYKTIDTVLRANLIHFGVSRYAAI